MQLRDYASIVSAAISLIALTATFYPLTRRVRAELRGQRLLDAALKTSDDALKTRLLQDGADLMWRSRVKYRRSTIAWYVVFAIVAAVNLGATIGDRVIGQPVTFDNTIAGPFVVVFVAAMARDAHIREARRIDETVQALRDGRSAELLASARASRDRRRRALPKRR